MKMKKIDTEDQRSTFWCQLYGSPLESTTKKSGRLEHFEPLCHSPPPQKKIPAFSWKVNLHRQNRVLCGGVIRATSVLSSNFFSLSFLIKRVAHAT